MALGAFINGLANDGQIFIGGSLDCFTPFSIFTGINVVVAYALLGSTWLVMKTSDGMKRLMRDLSVWISIARYLPPCISVGFKQKSAALKSAHETNHRSLDNIRLRPF
ncbi:cytochrome d ubiquinol oxidase subunit II [Pararhizobium sp. PWRC1-1]|uniref:cytochrome d ubiquinol oxidase subunit II n=1 Tax=Pararhizobium sp. PWRC1-1 TaxID=2804566 RepID=UPI003CEE747F